MPETTEEIETLARLFDRCGTINMHAAGWTQGDGQDWPRHRIWIDFRGAYAELLALVPRWGGVLVRRQWAATFGVAAGGRWAFTPLRSREIIAQLAPFLTTTAAWVSLYQDYARVSHALIGRPQFATRPAFLTAVAERDAIAEAMKVEAARVRGLRHQTWVPRRGRIVADDAPVTVATLRPVPVPAPVSLQATIQRLEGELRAARRRLELAEASTTDWQTGQADAAHFARHNPSMNAVNESNEEQTSDGAPASPSLPSS